VPEEDQTSRLKMVENAGGHLAHSVRVYGGQDKDERDNVQRGGGAGNHAHPVSRHITHKARTPTLTVVFVLLDNNLKN
jgi:hypothetical protein